MIIPKDWLREFTKDINQDNVVEDLFGLGFPVEEESQEYIDIEVTPNRGDVFSIHGAAREINAKNGYATGLYQEYEVGGFKNKSDIVSIDENAGSAVLRYAYLVAEVDVRASDELVCRRLKQIGLNAKNNIIDITNYLMHESGQPLHAFDLDKINQIRIGFAEDGNNITLINGDTLKLSSNTLVAYDNERIVDLAGVCGAENSSVDNNTKKVLIQAAIFDPATIRRTSKSTTTITPASMRYERGVDYNLPPQVITKCAKLFEQWGYRIIDKVDLKLMPQEAIDINFDSSDVESIAGIAVDSSVVNKSLNDLGFSTDGVITVPSWRRYDINCKQDVVEEVLRIVGYDKLIPAELTPAPAIKNSQAFHSGIIQAMTAAGFTEVWNYSFLSDKEADALGTDKNSLVEITNPISSENKYLRPSLLPKIAKAIASNPGFDKVSLFEIGNVFIDNMETTKVAAISTSAKSFNGSLINHKPLLIGPDSEIGRCYKLRKSVYFVEIAIDSIQADDDGIVANNNQYREISKYPAVVRDISVLVRPEVDVRTVAKSIVNRYQFVLLAEPFDEFESTKFNGNKSISLKIIIQDLNSTLSAGQADTMLDQILDYLSSEYDAKLRT